ncbi:MAG: sensor histidine kinase [Rhodanobacter sp.]
MTGESGREMASIDEVVDRVTPSCPSCVSPSSGMALADARLLQQLHDGPTQWMVLALLQLDRALGDRAAVDGRSLDNIRMLLNEALRSIRRVMDDWRGSVTIGPAPLMTSLLDLGRRLVSLTGLVLCLDCDDQVTEPPMTVTAIVLHAVQELLLNTCKHAPGAKADVNLVALGDGFKLMVCDDGPGFDLVAVYRRHTIVPGLGLDTMPERLASVGGAFSVYSRPGAGVQACICWPSNHVDRRALACASMCLPPEVVTR